MGQSLDDDRPRWRIHPHSDSRRSDEHLDLAVWVTKTGLDRFSFLSVQIRIVECYAPL